MITKRIVFKVPHDVARKALWIQSVELNRRGTSLWGFNDSGVLAVGDGDAGLEDPLASRKSQS